MCRTQVPIAVTKVFLSVSCPVCAEDKSHCSVFACGHWTCIDCSSTLVVPDTIATALLAESQALIGIQSSNLRSGLWWGLKVGQILGHTIIGGGLLVISLPIAVATGLLSVATGLPHGISQETFTWENQQVKWSWNRHHEHWILMMDEEDGSTRPWQGWSEPPRAAGARELRWNSRNRHWVCW